jgi:hypothetical protein
LDLLRTLCATGTKELRAGDDNAAVALRRLGLPHGLA